MVQSFNPIEAGIFRRDPTQLEYDPALASYKRAKSTQQTKKEKAGCLTRVAAQREKISSSHCSPSRSIIKKEEQALVEESDHDEERK